MYETIKLNEITEEQIAKIENADLKFLLEEINVVKKENVDLEQYTIKLKYVDEKLVGGIFYLNQMREVSILSIEVSKENRENGVGVSMVKETVKATAALSIEGFIVNSYTAFSFWYSIGHSLGQTIAVDSEDIPLLNEYDYDLELEFKFGIPSNFYNCL